MPTTSPPSSEAPHNGPTVKKWENKSGRARINKRDVVSVFADGGLMSGNPSPDGGTWAWRVIGDGDKVLAQAAGVFTPDTVGLTHVQNNLSEMVAILLALEWLTGRLDGGDWSGLVASDSLNAIRCFREPKVRDWVPAELWHRRVNVMSVMGSIEWLLLDGHPTAAHLEAGRGKKGKPVSVHNAFCDKIACQAGAEYLAWRDGGQARGGRVVFADEPVLEIPSPKRGKGKKL